MTKEAEKNNSAGTGWQGCTTIIVGKNATTDGSVIVAHSDDDVMDGRVIYVKQRSFEGGPKKTRDIFYDDCSIGHKDEYNFTELRRYIGDERGDFYTLDHEEKGAYNSRPIGSIPIEAGYKTYAYFDFSYGIMNEKQLMIGECTCGAKVHPEPEKDARLFYSAELSRHALERCENAREAIVYIAYLIDQYGYYGTGETLLIGDPDEAWVMEMCGYDLNGKGRYFDPNSLGGGLWVAQRVPDDRFFVAANEFRIRRVRKGGLLIEDDDKHDIKELLHGSIPDGWGDILKTCYPIMLSGGTLDDPLQLCSGNLFDVCAKLGWWNPNKEIKKEYRKKSGDDSLDWLRTVSWGEYGHPYYSLRRVWRCMDKVAPSENYSPWVEDGYTEEYPFSVTPDRKLSVADVAALYRDHYEGTEFDLTQGPAAGPFNDPTRYEDNPDQGDSFNLNTYRPSGAWERALSIFRCGAMWINQAKRTGNNSWGISWIGLDRPAANCLMPFCCVRDKILKGEKPSPLPDQIQTTDMDFKFPKIDDDGRWKSESGAWWAFNFVANYATIKYSYMIQDIKKKQGKLEGAAFAKVYDIQNHHDQVKFCKENADDVVSKWWELAMYLIVRYNDGCITEKKDGKWELMKKVGYPGKWLCSSGYYSGPTSYKKP